MRQILLLLLIAFPFDFFGQAAQPDCPPRQACANYGPTGKLNGFGVQTLNAGNQGCLATNEHNSDWVVVTISVSGTFEFTINPTAAFDDMDFAVWGPNPNCPVVGAPIRCSYAASGGGNTGVSSTNNAPQVDLTEGVGGNSWVQTMNVIAGQQYIILVDDFTNNKKYTMTFAGTASIICAPLPIELLSFNAILNSDHVDLTWETATETNNDFFTIEKSKDAVNFENVLRVNGAGNSTSVIKYMDIDSDPYTGISYYRLKQTDFNGQHSYSNIVPVAYNPDGDPSISLFPNPADAITGTSVSLNQLNGQEVLVVLRDIVGNEVYSKVVISSSDKEIIALDPDGKLAKGTYLVIASSENKFYSKKLIIK